MQYGRQLVSVTRKVPTYAAEGGSDSSKNPQLILESFKVHGLRPRIEDGVALIQEGKPIPVSTSFANELMGSLGLHDAPPVVGVIDHPVMRADGSMLHERGYDPETRLYLGAKCRAS